MNTFSLFVVDRKCQFIPKSEHGSILVLIYLVRDWIFKDIIRDPSLFATHHHGKNRQRYENMKDADRPVGLGQRPGKETGRTFRSMGWCSVGGTLSSSLVSCLAFLNGIHAFAPMMDGPWSTTISSSDRPQQSQSLGVRPFLPRSSDSSFSSLRAASKAPPHQEEPLRSQPSCSTTTPTTTTTTTRRRTWRLYGIEVHPDDLQWDPHSEQQRRRRQRPPNQPPPHDEPPTPSNPTTTSFTGTLQSELHPSILQALYHKYPRLGDTDATQPNDSGLGMAPPQEESQPNRDKARSTNNNKKKKKKPTKHKKQQQKSTAVLTVSSIRVVRRSLDARRHKPRYDGRGKGPRFVYVLDVDLESATTTTTNSTTRTVTSWEQQEQEPQPDESLFLGRWKPQPGKLELLSSNPMLHNQPLIVQQQPQKNKDEPFLHLLHNASFPNTNDSIVNNDKNISTRTVIIVGAGPAGLFCALELLHHNQRVLQTTNKRNNSQEDHSSPNDNRTIVLFQPIVLERGQPVERRGKDIGAIMAQRYGRAAASKQGGHTSNPDHAQKEKEEEGFVVLNPDSNFCFGEGGAGTWSDGKLTTRIGRNSDLVRRVLQTLVQYGAPSIILTEGAPHLGTDNLVHLLRTLRKSIETQGGQVWFGHQMTKLLFATDEETNQPKVIGVEYKRTQPPPLKNRMKRDTTDENKVQKDSVTNNEGILYGDAIVLATGHSARDVYQLLASSPETPVPLEAKGFAMGFRIEHPQAIINQLQYGPEWGLSVRTGKTTTDKLNQEHFEALPWNTKNATSDQDNQSTTSQPQPHERLPVPSYRLATDQAWDGSRRRGVYSFCMVRDQTTRPKTHGILWHVLIL